MENLINEMLDGRILLDEAITEFEKLYIQRALERHSGHISKTANALGIHRNTLSKRVAGYKETPKQISKRPASKTVIKKAKRSSAWYEHFIRMIRTSAL